MFNSIAGSLGFNLSPHDLFNTRANRRENRQLQLDNEFRQSQADLAEEWRQREWDFKDKKIQTLVTDARRAGISPLAALGSAGTQAPSFNIPVGQGGRISGKERSTISYNPTQVKSEGQLYHEQLNTQAATIANQNAATQSVIKTEMMRLELEKLREQTSDIPNLYLKAYPNTDEAVEMIRQGYMPYLNPEMNFEMLETIGSYHYGKPYLKEGMYKEGNTIHLFGDPTLRK